MALSWYSAILFFIAAKQKQNPPSDYDGAWKDGWKQHLQPFLEVYFPKVAALVDWSFKPVWLDKEIEKIIAHTGKEKGNRADLLVQVTLKDGVKQILLLHIEIQSHWDDALADRVHRYWSGLYYQTGEKVISLVVLADTNPKWHPKVASFEFANFKSELRFETCKLLDLDLENPNHQGLAYEIARAQIASLKTTDSPKSRYDAKKRLLLSLYKTGYTADDVRAAYGMIDHMMLLGEALKKRLNQDIFQFEQEINMPFVTSAEEAGIEKGIEKVAVNMIELGKSNEEIAEATKLSIKEVESLRDSLKDS